MENLDAGGDPLRHYSPKAADGTSAMFHSINRGKGSIALPFRDPAVTQPALVALLEEADVLVESFRPGTLEKLLGIASEEDLLRRCEGWNNLSLKSSTTERRLAACAYLTGRGLNGGGLLTLPRARVCVARVPRDPGTRGWFWCGSRATARGTEPQGTT